jgi:hypothetical protein
MDEDGLVKYIRDITKAAAGQLDAPADSYRYRDITIITNRQDDSSSLRTRLEKYFPIQERMKYPVTGIRVLTVEEMVSLDAQVCIYIARPDEFADGKTASNTLNDKRFRAFVSSRCIKRLVYIINKIDIKAATVLGIGNLER